MSGWFLALLSWLWFAWMFGAPAGLAILGICVLLNFRRA